MREKRERERAPLHYHIDKHDFAVCNQVFKTLTSISLQVGFIFNKKESESKREIERKREREIERDTERVVQQLYEGLPHLMIAYER